MKGSAPTTSLLAAVLVLVAGAARADLRTVAAELRPSLATVVALRPAADAADPTAGRVRLVGTGVFVSESRLITSSYVVDAAAGIFVELADGRRLPAALIGGDRLSRLALLELREPVGKPVALDRARGPVLGQPIAVMGTGYGFPNKLSTGIVCGLDRTIMDEGLPAMGTAFEISAKADPGMSGAPVFSPDDGALVGVVLISTVPEPGSVHSPIDGAGLIAYNLLLPEALPEQRRTGPPVIVANPLVLCAEGDTLRFAADSLMATGEVRWGRVGLSVAPTPQDLVAHYRLGGHPGAVVTSVAEGGPAATAGLEPGDILVQADGVPLDNGGALMRQTLTRPGQSVRLGYLRSGERREATVALGAAIAKLPGLKPELRSAWLGAVVSRTSTTLAQTLGLAKNTSVSIVSVSKGGPADEAGLVPGDVIVGLDGATLGDGALEALTAKVSGAAAGTALKLLVLREGKRANVEVKLASVPAGFALLPAGFDPDVADL